MFCTKYIVIIPAYNEESTILDSLSHVLKASQQTKGYSLEKIIVCINGCTDRTAEIVHNWDGYPVEIIESKRGYVNAMNLLFRYAQKNYPDLMMIKTDADARVDPKAFSVLFEQLKMHPKIIVAGGHPTPIASTSINPYRRLLSKVLSVRSRNPEAEITISNSTRFHPYAKIDPIPELHGREALLKIYFHGRLWCARSSSHIPLLPPELIGEDVYIPGWLLQKYGPESIRLDYRAKVLFHPNDSLVRYWKVYRRVFEDRKIVYSMQGFDFYAKACPLKLDWNYIKQYCSLQERINFVLYAALAKIVYASYHYTVYNASYWQYGKKEG